MRQHRFPAPAPVRLEVRVVAGSIEVATTDEGESAVTIEGMQDVVDAVTVELVDDRLLIVQRRKQFLERGDRSVRVRVHVPARSSIDVASQAAGAFLEGTFAGVDIRSAAGDIRVVGDIEGDARVRTVSGDIDLPDVAGDVDVRTVSGDIDAGAVRAVSGSVAARSVSGRIRLGSAREGAVRVTSVSGDVEIGVAPGTNLDIDAASVSGEVTSEVLLTAVRAAVEGPTLVVRGKTVSGDVRVVRA